MFSSSGIVRQTLAAFDHPRAGAVAVPFKTFGMVCLNRRFYSVLEHGLARLASNGPIRGIVAEIPHAFTKDRQSGRLSDFDYEHYFVRNSIHGADLVRYVLGDQVRVHSLASANPNFMNAAASYAAILEYERGVVATITCLWDTPEVPRLKVIAEDAWLEFEPLERGWYCTPNGKKTPIPADQVDKEYRPGVYARDLCFVQALQRGVKPTLPACLLPDAYKTMCLAEQIMGGSLRPQGQGLEPALRAPVVGGGDASGRVRG